MCRLGGTLRGLRAQRESAFEVAKLYVQSEGETPVRAISDGLQRFDARQCAGCWRGRGWREGCCWRGAHEASGDAAVRGRGWREGCCWRGAHEASGAAAVPVAAVEHCAEPRSTRSMHRRDEQQRNHLAVGATSRTLMFSVAAVKDRGAPRRRTEPRAHKPVLERRDGPPTRSPTHSLT